jgi:iron only hydrogenase large subunit-like protein
MASIFLANLDADAIGLGASCTRPEVLARDQSSARKRITLEAEDDNTVGFTPAGPIQALTNGSAQVSVSDCLACSGCVTSAESVLLAEQAAPKLGILCNEGRPVDVVIDRAALASVAQKFDCTPSEALARLRTACTAALPVRRVVAATDAQDLQLLETLHEFERRLEREDAGLSASRETPPPTVAVSSTSYKDPKTNQVISYHVEPKTEAPLPLVTSQCPGVVCFLEKTAPHALPYLSSTKSPMAAAAAVVQDAAICYVGACADKKLEGYRRDLMDDDVPHISLVLTLTEFVEAIGADRLEATQAVPTEADARDTRVHAQSQAASGGYADFVYRCVAGREPEWKRGRNNDVVECTLEREGLRPLKFAIATGFRNVQRVVAALKRTKPQYDFVELLACPVRSPRRQSTRERP